MKNIRSSLVRTAAMATLAASAVQQKPRARKAIVTRDPNYSRLKPEAMAIADDFYSMLRTKLEARGYTVLVTSMIDELLVREALVWIAHGIEKAAFKGAPPTLTVIALETKINNKKFKNKKDKFSDPLYYTCNQRDIDAMQFM